MDPVTGTAAALYAGGEVLSSLFGGLFGSSQAGKRRKEREFVRQQIMQMIAQLRKRPQQGIMSPEQQELAIRQQRQAMQPTMSRLAGHLASTIGLQQPVAQMGLARYMGSQEAGQRFQMGQMNLKRMYETEQNLRRLMAMMTTSMPS